MTACSGDMLLQALVACAGVTVGAVATALRMELRGGAVAAEGDLDFRGTLAVAKDVPIGFKQIRIHISLNSDGSGNRESAGNGSRASLGTACLVAD